MTITTATILFFGSLADHFGRSREMEIAAGGERVASLRRRLAEHHPAILAAGVRVAIAQQVVGDVAVAHADEEIAFFSPVSGG